MQHEFKDPTPPKPPVDKPIPGPSPKDGYCAARDGFLQAHRIQNVQQLMDYVLHELGSPQICVELDQQTMLYAILDIVQWFHKYYYGYGAYQDYLIMELQPGKHKYKLCQELQSVVDFKTTNWFGSINELFTVPHALLYDQVLSMNNTWNGACYGNSAAYGDILGSWTATLTWMAEADMLFGEKYQVSYNEYEQELTVYPTPKKPTKGLMKVYKRQRTEQMFNDPMFRKMLVAHCGKLWTNRLRKYQISIAGGSGTLNSDSLYASYEKDYDWCVEHIEFESPCGHVLEVS